MSLSNDDDEKNKGKIRGFNKYYSVKIDEKKMRNMSINDLLNKKSILSAGKISHNSSEECDQNVEESLSINTKVIYKTYYTEFIITGLFFSIVLYASIFLVFPEKSNSFYDKVDNEDDHVYIGYYRAINLYKSERKLKAQLVKITNSSETNIDTKSVITLSIEIFDRNVSIFVVDSNNDKIYNKTINHKNTKNIQIRYKYFPFFIDIFNIKTIQIIFQSNFTSI